MTFLADFRGLPTDNPLDRSRFIVAVRETAVKDPVSLGLKNLANGLRPYVAARVRDVLRDEGLSGEIQSWDAQALLVFMWDRWNDLFRSDLTYVERSLISELRDFRNRWAHQNQLTERDVYRVLDDAERLLLAIQSSEANFVAGLRRESLGRLWDSERGTDARHRKLQMLWPFIICGTSAISLSAVIIGFGKQPWSGLLSALIVLALMRVAWHQARREARQGHGPHECTRCGRIIYSVECPYCQPPQDYPGVEEHRGVASLLTASRPGLRASDTLASSDDTAAVRSSTPRTLKG